MAYSVEPMEFLRHRGLISNLHTVRLQIILFLYLTLHVNIKITLGKKLIHVLFLIKPHLPMESFHSLLAFMKELLQIFILVPSLISGMKTRTTH